MNATVEKSPTNFKESPEVHIEVFSKLLKYQILQIAPIPQTKQLAAKYPLTISKHPLGQLTYHHMGVYRTIILI